MLSYILDLTWQLGFPKGTKVEGRITTGERSRAGNKKNLEWQLHRDYSNCYPPECVN